MIKITAVKSGEVEIDGKTFFSDMIVWWDGKFEYKSKSHEFNMSDFLKLAEKKPDIIVIGTGMNNNLRVLEEVKQAADDKKIEIYQEFSPKAAKMFNAFVADKKKAVTVIHCSA